MIKPVPGVDREICVDWTRVQAIECRGPNTWLSLVSSIECQTTLPFEEAVKEWASNYPLENRILVSIENSFAIDLYRVQMVDHSYSDLRYPNSYVAYMVSGVKCPVSCDIPLDSFISMWSNARDKKSISHSGRVYPVYTDD